MLSNRKDTNGGGISKQFEADLFKLFLQCLEEGKLKKKDRNKIRHTRLVFVQLLRVFIIYYFSLISNITELITIFTVR